MKATSLTQLETREVSLVKRGAVKRKFALTKADMDEVLKAVLDTPVEDEAKVDEACHKANLSPRTQEVVKGAVRLLTAFKDDLPPWVIQLIAQLAGFQVDEMQEDATSADENDQDLVNAQQDATGADDNSQKLPPPKKKPPFPPAQENHPMAKADNAPATNVSAEVQAQLDGLFKSQQEAVAKAADLEKQLKAERDARRTRECVEKAAREYPSLGPAEEVGAVLKALDEVPGELASHIEKLLKTAGERQKTAALFVEKGREGANPQPSSALEAIEKCATEEMRKDASLTKGAAFDLVLRKNPELYAAYRNEKRS